MRLVLLLFAFVTILPFLSAQSITQTIRGEILDVQSEIPLIGATVECISVDPIIGTTTDVDGRFKLTGIPVGRHDFRISYLGYEPAILGNVVVTAGKEVQLNAALLESVADLSEVVVTAQPAAGATQNEMATVSTRSFSVEEAFRYSGGRSDIGRLAANFAGVSTPDDSRNDIVIRGNSPTGVLWRLEGIPIPNPNHFSTLGTTGGPVSAVNPNLLSNSDFLTGAFPAEYGNALAGVFDLNFRRGNRDKYEFMFQLGAISGLEGMAEGPIGTRGSFVIAGRYSFIGLLGSALDIGTAATPDYRDIGFRMDLPAGKKSTFTLFGIGGSSDIAFLAGEVDEDDIFAAEDEDAFADSRFGVVGLRHNFLLSNDSYLRTIVSVSGSQNLFTQDRYFNLNTDQEFTSRYGEADNTEVRYALSTFWNKKFSARLTTRIGVLAERFEYDLLSSSAEEGPDADDDGVRELVTLFNFNEGTTLLQPYAQGMYRLGDRWTIGLGLHFQYSDLNDQSAIEPRFSLEYQLAKGQRLTFGYGWHEQVQPLPILLAQGTTEADPLPNENLDFSRSQHFVLGHNWSFAPSWRLKTELYYQFVDQVPVDSFASSFSLLNAGADFGFPQGKLGLVNEGTGRNYGLEITLEKFFSDGYYALVTTSLYDSQYEGSDGVERNTAFNSQYVLNVLAGREWPVGKDGRNALTFDTKLTTAGGRYFTPVDLAASQAAGTEVLQEELAFSEQYPSYFRWDVRIGVRLNSKKRNLSHQFYFDIQNVTNRENIFVRRYNRLTGEVNDALQLGLFPDFLYRLQF